MSTTHPPVGSIVEFLPYMSAYGGCPDRGVPPKRGVVKDVVHTPRARGGATSLRVQITDRRGVLLSERVVRSRAVRMVLPRGVRDKRSQQLLQVEQKAALQEQFADVRARVRRYAGVNIHRPPSWVKEVTDRADRMPLSFVRLHAHRKVKGHEIPEGQISSGSAGGHDGDQYSDGGAGPASDHASRSHPSPPPLHLRSMEHVSSALQRRLERGQGTDDAQMLQALNQSQGILLGKASDALIQKGIKPLMVMSESRYTEIQRDSASALHSLAINKENKVKFMQSKALGTLVKLSRSNDIDIKLNVVGAMHRLAMDEQVKRPFVLAGVLDPILAFLESPATPVGRDIQRKAIFTLKELVENSENRQDLLQRAPLLPAIFNTLRHEDARVRRCAAWTLERLAKQDANKILMLNASSFGRILTLLRTRNTEMRRAGSSCLASLADFTRYDEFVGVTVSVDGTREGDYSATVEAAAAAAEQLGSAWTQKALLDAIHVELEADILADLCRTCQSIVKTLPGPVGKIAHSHFLEHGGLLLLVEQAARLLAVEHATASDVEALRFLVDTAALTMKEAPAKRLLEMLTPANVGVILALCKSTNKFIRRGAAQMLALLSELDESKFALAGHVAEVLQITNQLTVSRVLAELTIAPSNRNDIMQELCMSPMLELLLDSTDVDIQMELSRALARLSEAVENRPLILYSHGALDSINALMNSENDLVQLRAVTCIANLVSPAGAIAGTSSEMPTVGRFGATTFDLGRQLLQADDAYECIYEWASWSQDIAGKNDPQWWDSTEGRRYRRAYNAATIDRVHLRVADSEALSTLMVLRYHSASNVAALAEEALRHLVCQNHQHFDFDDVRASLISHGFAKTRARYRQEGKIASWADGSLDMPAVTPSSPLRSELQREDQQDQQERQEAQGAGGLSHQASAPTLQPLPSQASKTHAPTASGSDDDVHRRRPVQPTSALAVVDRATKRPATFIQPRNHDNEAARQRQILAKQRRMLAKQRTEDARRKLQERKQQHESLRVHKQQHESLAQASIEEAAANKARKEIAEGERTRAKSNRSALRLYAAGR